jgi:hypothetical protein
MDSGLYVLKIISTPGDPSWGILGYDPYNPYLLRVDFSPGPDLEAGQEAVANFPIGPADSYLDANEIVFSEGNVGRAELWSYSYYFQDYDWYQFTTEQDGWLRVTGDMIGFSPDVSDIDIILHYSIYTKNPQWQQIGNYDFIGDPPNSPASVKELTDIHAGETYYLRIVNSTGYSRSFPYHFVFEHQTGGIEDGEPGDAPNSESEYQAYDLGVLQKSQPVSHQSYFWHEGDTDFYEAHTSIGTNGILCLTLSYQESYQSKGWYDRCDNPLGIYYLIYFTTVPTLIE